MKLSLLAAIPSLDAEAALQSVGPTLGAEEYHALVLQATGSKAAADRATYQRMAAQQRSGQKVT